MRGIGKRFPGVQALKDARITLHAGEVLCLAGENGAGKSTLMKILAGAQQPDEGEIVYLGEPVRFRSPHHAQTLGISMIYQEFNLVPQLSVAENIFLGRAPTRGGTPMIDWRAMNRMAEESLARIGVKLDVRRPVVSLSIAEQQMVEIAKALSIDARVIVMDEPSATLTDHELEHLFELIRNLRRQQLGVIYISHRLEEIFAIGTTVCIMRDGEHEGTYPVHELEREDIIRKMVGRDLKDEFPKEVFERGRERLRVEGLTRRPAFQDVSFSLHEGEIVGLTGLVGAGRTEVARAIFGADPPDAGSISLDGAPLRAASPRQAIAAGIGLLTEDRKQQGLVLGMTVRENTTMANLSAVCSGPFLRAREERAAASRYVDELRIKTPGIEQAAQFLSGGNQQKVVLAKWLFTESRVLIFDEPTRGIDVGAKAEIYKLMNELIRRGAAILMISSELPEILGMCDRILVMHEGRITGELSRAEATQEAIMRLATGSQAAVA
jgi:ribose transport system ATP-binding protein